jgi:hypothetical protein
MHFIVKIGKKATFKMNNPEKRFCAIIMARSLKLSAGIILATAPFTDINLSLVIAGGLFSLAEMIRLGEKTF